MGMYYREKNSINSKNKSVTLGMTKIARNFVQKTVLTSLVFGIPFSLLDSRPAVADISGLTPCAESKGFAKLKKQELKELQKRLKKYEPDSAPALALKGTMDRTEKRFNFYGDAGLL